MLVGWETGLTLSSQAAFYYFCEAGGKWVKVCLLELLLAGKGCRAVPKPYPRAVLALVLLDRVAGQALP